MSIGAAAGRSVHVGLRSYRPLPVSRRFCSSDPTPSRDKPTQRSTFRPKPSSTHDWIGPPNPLSNLRPIVYHIPEKESDLEKRLRMLRQETEDWNHEFWTKQNISFSKVKMLLTILCCHQQVAAKLNGENPLESFLWSEMSRWYQLAGFLQVLEIIADVEQSYFLDETKNCFEHEKEAFIISHLKAKGLTLRDEDGRRRSLNSEEMALFYKSFLDQNKLRHANYNREWYRRNFSITVLMARVAVTSMWRTFTERHHRKNKSSPNT